METGAMRHAFATMACGRILGYHRGTLIRVNSPRDNFSLHPARIPTRTVHYLPRGSITASILRIMRRAAQASIPHVDDFHPPKCSALFLREDAALKNSLHFNVAPTTPNQFLSVAFWVIHVIRSLIDGLGCQCHSILERLPFGLTTLLKQLKSTQ